MSNGFNEQYSTVENNNHTEESESSDVVSSSSSRTYRERGDKLEAGIPTGPRAWLEKQKKSTLSVDGGRSFATHIELRREDMLLNFGDENVQKPGAHRFLFQNTPILSDLEPESEPQYDFERIKLPNTSPSPSPPPLNRRTTPSPSYLEESKEPSIISTEAPRKLLVLDLNGTLIFRTARNKGQRRSHSRPYMPSFREYLFCEETQSWLDVMVWSSAQPHNVAEMVEKCFGSDKDDLLAVWGRDTLGLGKEEYGRKVQTIKDLNKPWAYLASESDRRHSALSTILLDDSPQKAVLQPYNHICLPEYDAIRRRKDVISSSAVIARALLREKLKGMSADTSGTIHGDTAGNDAATLASEEAVSDGVDTSTLHSPTLKRLQSSSPQESSNEDPQGASGGKRKKKKKSRFGPEVAEGELVGQSKLELDETLLAVIGVLEEAKQQSNIAGWIRSGGIWANHFEDANTRRSLEGQEVNDESLGDSDTARVQDTFPPSSQTVAGTDHNSDNDSTHSVERNVASRLPSPENPVAAGNDNSTLADLSPERHTGTNQINLTSSSSPIRSSSPESKIPKKPGRHIVDQELPLWFEQPRIVAYWAKRGREALQRLGIPELHGVSL